MKNKLLVSFLILTSCTPLMRSQTAMGIGAAACMAGLSATSAGQDWGSLVSAAGCWLADWSAARADKLAKANRENDGLESALIVKTVDPLDKAAVELAIALSEATPENSKNLAKALDNFIFLSETVSNE